MEISSKVKQALLFLKKNLAGREAKKLSLTAGTGTLVPAPAGAKVFCFPRRGAFFSKKKRFLPLP